MAAFPSTLEPSDDSRIIPDSGLKTYVTEGGGVRGRKQYSGTVYKLDLIYPDLDDTEYTDVMNHYTGGPTASHTVSVRGVSYTVNYANEPATVDYHGILRTLRVEFLGVKT